MYRSIESYIHAKWVFNCKANEYGWLKKSKSRLEARGTMQKACTGFGELSAPLVAVSGVRLLAALAREQSLTCATLISSRNLYNLISMSMYLCVYRRVCGGIVVEMNKSMYGLKHASRQ